MKTSTFLLQRAINRCRMEIKMLEGETKNLNFICRPRETTGYNAYRYWDVFYKGYSKTLYEGSYLHAEIEISSQYPINPPKMKFISKMYHPNIYENGNVCISILNVYNDDPTGYDKPEYTWSPANNMMTIVLSVIAVLNEPNDSSPANIDAAKEFRMKRKEYENKVRDLANKESVLTKKVMKELNISLNGKKEEISEDNGFF